MKRTKERGVKPYTPQQKIVIALKKVCPGFMPGCSTWLRDIVIKSVDSQPSTKGELCSSSGTCVMHFRRTSDGTILSPKNYRFDISCEDTKDQYGLPDVSVVEHNFSEI